MFFSKFSFYIQSIPGQLNDRRTPLGELNWIFTAVTDTIAWNTLPRGKIFILCLKCFNQNLTLPKQLSYFMVLPLSLTLG